MYWKSKCALSMSLLLVAMATGVHAQSAPTPSEANQEAAKAKLMLIRQAEFLNDAIRESSQEIEIASKKIESGIRSLRQKSVSDIAFEDVFAMLQMQKVELTIELKGLEARLKLLQEKAIASTGSNEVEQVQKELLLRYVANQKRGLETTRSLFEKGAVPDRDLRKAEQSLAEAELRVKEFEMQARQASPAYVEATFDTSLAIAERKAKLDAVEEMLSRHIDSRSELSELQQVMETRAAESARMRELMFELKKLQAVGAQF